MKREDISRAVGEIDDRFIEEAAEADGRKQTRLWLRAGIPAAACFAVILAAVLYFPGTNTEDACIENDAAPPAGSEMYRESDGKQAADAEQLPQPQQEDLSEEDGWDSNSTKLRLAVNAVKVDPSAAQDILLHSEDFDTMDEQGLLDYYEAELPVQDILPELKPAADEEERGVYRTDGGTGTVYRDCNEFRFSDAKGEKTLSILLSRVEHPVRILPELMQQSLKFTNVSGRELVVFRSTDAELFAEWMQKGTGWQISAAGLSDEEFLQLLEGLVKPDKAQQTHHFTGELTAIDPGARYVAVSGEDGAGYGVRLPEDVEIGQLRLFDRVTLSWRGEPATLETIWAEQLTAFEKEEQP